MVRSTTKSGATALVVTILIICMRLNTIDGVKRVIRQEIRDGYMVEVELDEDYPISALLVRVKREVTSWAIRNKVQLSTEP